MHNEELLTTAEAAERLSVSVFTVNRYARDGSLAVAHKLPGLRGANLYAAADAPGMVPRRPRRSGGDPVSTLQIIGLLLAVPTGFMFIRLVLRGDL